MRVGDLVKLHPSYRRTGRYAGLIALIVGRDKHGQYLLMTRGQVRKFHTTQILNVITEGDK